MIMKLQTGHITGLTDCRRKAGNIQAPVLTRRGFFYL